MNLDFYSGICKCFRECISACNLMLTCKILYEHLLPYYCDIIELHRELYCASDRVVTCLLQRRDLIYYHDILSLLRTKSHYLPYIAHSYLSSNNVHIGFLLHPQIFSSVDKDLILEFALFDRFTVLHYLSCNIFERAKSNIETQNNETLIELFLIISDDAYYAKPLELDQDNIHDMLMDREILVLIFLRKHIIFSEEDIEEMSLLLEYTSKILDNIRSLKYGDRIC